MPIGPLVVAVIIVVRLLARGWGSSSGASPGPTSSGGAGMGSAAGFAAVVRVGVASVWLVLFFLAFANLGELLSGDVSFASGAGLVGTFGALGAFGLALFAPWPLLRRLARRADPKVVYYLARLSMVFSFTGETRPAAILLGALAVAHRGPADADTLEWFRSRLRTESSALGTFGAAFGLLEALEARVARDEGLADKAHFHGEQARWLLGTVTYMSQKGVPSPVRTLVHELLDLECAAHGLWGGLENTPEQNLTPLSRAVRDWARRSVRKEGDEVVASRSRARAHSPFIEQLYARRPDAPPPSTAAEARSRVCYDYLILARGGAISPRAALNVLQTFDVLLHPMAPDTVLPESVRDDEELVSSVQEDVAEELARALYQSRGVPLYAMTSPGPVSARVYQKVETSILNDLERDLARMIELNKAQQRSDPMTEWLEASRARVLYRRVQLMLGESAVAQVWPRLMFAYCNFAVKLSETWPRRRPLAYAAFSCLYNEALRMEDFERVALLDKNCRVTSGAV